MSDELPTVDVKPGVETSEYKMARLVVLVGGLVAALGGVLTTLSQFGLGDNKYVGLGLVVVGVATKILTYFGYQNARADLKSQALEHSAQERQIAVSKVIDMASATQAINDALGVK